MVYKNYKLYIFSGEYLTEVEANIICSNSEFFSTVYINKYRVYNKRKYAYKY